ncbi:MAG: hypothetical protein AAFU78_16115 [Cyanobacteria bacterium J06633_2]
MNTIVNLSKLSSDVAPHCSLPTWPVSVPKKPSLDWHKLVALGVQENEAKAICDRLKVRDLMQSYYHILSHAGIPLDDVKPIAHAIAKFDVTDMRPSKEQRAKICQYASLICRANLWRPSCL